MVAAIAARSGADVAVEIRRCSEKEGGAEHSWVPPAEVGDGVDLRPGVQHGFEECVPAEFLGDCDGDGSAANDVARLAPMGMAPPVGPQVADDHHVGPVAPALAASVLHHPHECQSSKR